MSIMATEFCAMAPYAFSIIIPYFSLCTERCISSHAPRKQTLTQVSLELGVLDMELSFRYLLAPSLGGDFLIFGKCLDP